MYTMSTSLTDTSFAEAVERTKSALSQQGFGVLTEIDAKATMKKKIGADIPDYTILGACNPQMAHKAMQVEPKVGAMLPCNVIVRATEDGAVEVSAIDPVASMMAIENDELKSLAGEVRGMLREVVDSLR